MDETLVQLSRSFQSSWTLLLIAVLIPFYLYRDNIKSKKQMFKYLSVIIGYFAMGYTMQIYFDQLLLTAAQFEIILFMGGVTLAAFVFPKYLSLFELKFEQTFKLNTNGAYMVLINTLKALRAKILLEKPSREISALYKGSYGMDFLLDIEVFSEKETKAVLRTSIAGNTLTRFRILFVIASYSPIFSFANRTFLLEVPLIGFQYNSELGFFTIWFIFVMFDFLMANVNKNFIYIVEEVQKEQMLQLARKATRAKGSTALKKPDVNLDRAKSKAEEIKRRSEEIRQRQLREEIEQKRQKLRNRVKGVMGEDEEAIDIDPETLKHKILIEKTKTVLKSTPIFRNVKIGDIANMVGEEDTEKVERIVIGLINNKEVNGFYDIWDKVYLPGDTTQRYIEKTLNEMELRPSDLEYIRLTRGGDVEIRFKHNGKDHALEKKQNEDVLMREGNANE